MLSVELQGSMCRVIVSWYVFILRLFSPTSLCTCMLFVKLIVHGSSGESKIGYVYVYNELNIKTIPNMYR